MSFKRIIQAYLSSCWIPATAFLLLTCVLPAGIGLIWRDAYLIPMIGEITFFLVIVLVLGVLMAAIYQFKNQQKSRGWVSLFIFGLFLIPFWIGISEVELGRNAWEKAGVVTGEEVVRVLNCNTLKLDNGRTIRLIGVDCRDSDAAMRYLEGLFAEFGPVVRLEKSGDKKQYASGHVLADVSIVQKEGDPNDPDYVTKINVNRAMIGVGYGQADAATK